MMAKMMTEEKCLHIRYFYNSVIEFIYFLILYLETYGTASVNDINRYVKFFKTEVTDLISSFRGKTPVEKLDHMLKNLDYFIVCESKFRLDNIIDLKDVIFEDLVISKCVDLLLRRHSNIDDLWKNLNLNSVVTIDKQNLLHIIKKYSYISICNYETVTLHHFHGLIGFEDYICKSIICYFHEILHHSKTLTYEDIRNHSKSLSFCGLNNMIEILSILHCSHQFTCQDGFVYLSKKSKKYRKQRPIHIEKMQTSFSSRYLHIGQIVHDICGSYLHQWTGEIITIGKNHGVIYCAIDFTDGHQGVFRIYFSKSELKVISELDDLRKYLNVRDVVKFDAEYYNSKIPDRCWKATKVKLCSNKFRYDEVVSDKISYDSELKRSKCLNNKYCSKFNLKVNNSFKCSLNVKDKKCNKTNLVGKKLKTSDYESCSSNDDSNIGLETDCHNIPNFSSDQKLPIDFCLDVSDEQILDYLFMFGSIYMLMENKGIAIANYGNKCYNILFMNNSVYAPNKSEHFFLKGQKILAAIPYRKNVENLESVCISTFVYGLNEKEINETEKMNISPKEFATKIFSHLSNLYCNCHNYYKSFDNFPQEFTASELRYKIQIYKLHNFIKTQYKLPFTNDKMLLLLHSIWKAKSKNENFDNKVFQYFVNLGKHLLNHVNQMKIMRKNKRKTMILYDDYEFNVQKEISQQDFSIETSKKKFNSENDVLNVNLFTKGSRKRMSSENGISNLHLKIKTNSLNESSNSQNSFSSYKTCSTNCSEVFYSCASELNSHKKFSDSFVDNDTSDIPKNEGSPFNIVTVPEIQVTNPLPTILNDKCKILSIHSSQYLKMKVQRKFKKVSKLRHNKCLSLQSVPSFKCTFKNWKKEFVSSCPFKAPCKNCASSSLILKARISLISKSFFFFATNIDGHDIVLPFPKKSVPSGVLENIKLDSAAEIVVIPSAILNLSHILTFHIFI